MIKRILTIAIVLLLASCATQRTSNRIGLSHEKSNALNLTPASNDLVIVYVIRDDRFTGSGVNVLIGVDKQPIVALDNHSFTRIDLPPGRYKFKYAVNAEDLNKSTSEYIHGAEEYLIKAGEINIVQFLGGNKFYLADEAVYGRAMLKRLIHEADYQVPYQQIIRTAKPLAPAPAQLKIASAKKARIVKKKQASGQFAQYQARAKCTLINNDWVYTGSQCKKGMAHGKGSAEDRQGLKFIGLFAAGQRVKGEIHQNNNMIFSGSLVDDKPEGSAICFYEGEYEECRFFKGKRIDTLYKIRKENEKMKGDIAQMKQSRPSASSRTKGIGDYAEDALKKEATDRAASFIFDQLF